MRKLYAEDYARIVEEVNKKEREKEYKSFTKARSKYVKKLLKQSEKEIKRKSKYGLTNIRIPINRNFRDALDDVYTYFKGLGFKVEIKTYQHLEDEVLVSWDLKEVL